jgi:hypothetical protein
MPVQIKPGIYEGILFSDYQEWDAINNSGLKILTDPTKCPAHCKHYLLNGRPDTPALKFGRALDAYILEPLRFMEIYSVMPDADGRTKAGKAIKAEFEAKLKPGQEIICENDYAKIQEIYSFVSGSRAIRLIRDGKSQVCLVWEDKTTGLLCKARLDYLNVDIPMITDLKSAADCSPLGFGWAIYRFMYYQQLGFYAMGYKAVTGDEPNMAIFAIEKEQPYVHAAYELGDKTIETGKKAARKALTIYKECLDSGQWPMHSDQIEILDMPLAALEKAGYSPYEL